MDVPVSDAIHVVSREEGLGRVEDDGMRQWYDWQPGVLFPYGQFTASGPFYFGGLTRERDRFVLVEAKTINSSRRALLWELAQKALGAVEAPVVEAYCDRMEREWAEDFTHPNEAFQADALSRQVGYWISHVA